MQAALAAAADRVRVLLDEPDATVSATARLVRFDGGTSEAAIAETLAHFPASLVKLFHAVAFLRGTAAGTLTETAEDCRALEALLRLSSNDADQYLMRRLCPPPPETLAEPPAAFMAAREALSTAWPAIDPLAYHDLRVSNATYEDGPFGIEAETGRSLGRNRMTARAGLAILRSIAGEDTLLAAADAARLRGWLDRTWARPPNPTAGTAGQVAGFLSQAMPPDAAVWSKGGWTEETRHDTLHATFAGGARICLVVLISGRRLWGRDDLLPAFARSVLARGGICEPT